MESMKTAVCTLVVGERYERLFQKYVLDGWKTYCKRQSYDLIIFRKPLADLPGKSPSWQKLFILDQPELRGFQKIIWLDADIIIRSDAPPVEVPSSRLGYVREIPSDGDIASWYQTFSLPEGTDIVQGGVLCLEADHRPILESVRDFPETALYEMPALSACISNSGVGYHLDPRFNALIPRLMQNYVSEFVLKNKPLKELLWIMGYPPLRKSLRDICEQNWFLHAAGAKRDLIKAGRYLRRSAKDEN